MSIKSELSVLKVNIQNAKDKLYTNLTEKGVTDITTASTLDAMADSVSGITTGGGNSFEAIGYEATPQYIQDAIDYTQTTYNKDYSQFSSLQNNFSNDKRLMFPPYFDSSKATDMSLMFASCNNLQYVPPYNTSNVTKMNDMFYCCFNLTEIDVSSFDTSNVTNMQSMFHNCWNLTEIDVSSFDTSNVTNMQNIFYGCSGITSLDLSQWNTSNVKNMEYMFQNCKNLTEIDVSSFDTSNVTNMNQFFYSSGKLNRVDGYISIKSLSKLNNLLDYYAQPNLYKITFKDLGYNSNFTNFDMSYATKWGVNNDTITDARQSLVDSLITYSFDRATNGYSTCTVNLSKNTKAVLTEDEIAQITAKGFTIA